MKKLIIINGPSCAGKSTIIDEFFLYQKSFFWLKYDAIKRFFVDYEPTHDKEKVQELVTTIGRDRIDRGEDILLENHIGPIVEFARENGYDIFGFDIEVPYPVLLQRFQERVVNIKTGVKINTSEERHRGIYDAYISNKRDGGITFDTSILSKEEIVERIMALVYTP
jgi:predicted ABC-type ATPase